MKSIEANGYKVFFNENGYTALNLFITQNNYSNIFIISDTNSNENCLPKFLPLLETDKNNEIIEIEPGETEKNINTCVEIWSILTELGADRKSLVINIGGGVITDIGGFIASTFKRGIDFVNIPTTLLAMVDASIGGKNGVDLGNLKNQIGVINVPKMVIIDTDFLSTLPQNEMRSGLAEMLKHGLIFDEKYWNEFKDLNQKDFTDFDQLIHRSVEIKNEIVILESFISWKKELLTETEFIEIKSTINSIFETIIFEENDLQPILNLLIHDKKNEYGEIQFALLDGIGKTKINQQVDNELIVSAFKNYKS
jgi:3-dehydroquinate synthase